MEVDMNSVDVVKCGIVKHNNVTCDSECSKHNVIV